MLTRTGKAIRNGAIIAVLSMMSVAVHVSDAGAAPPPCPPTDPACQNGGGGGVGGGPAPQPPPWIPPDQYAQDARAALVVPPPVVHTTPKSPTYVQLKTSFWIGPGVWAPFTSTAGPADETVTVTATPKSLRWDFADGSTPLTCTGPGSPDDMTTCIHTYLKSSATQPGRRYTVNVLMTWDVSWTCAGANCRGDLGPNPMPNPLTMPGNAQLEVGEIQSNSSTGA